MRSLRALVFLSLAASGAMVVSSCLLGGFDQVDTDPIVILDAGVDSGDAGALCVHAAPPGPPTVSNAGGTVSFVTAVHDISFGEETGSPPVGLDLDRTCTCEGESTSCVPPNKAADCDGVNGVDDAALGIIHLLQTALGSSSFGSKFFSDKADAGYWSLLFKVRDYNGMPDDDQVELDIYPVAGSPTVTPADTAPHWDGTDKWPILDSSLADGVNEDLPKYSDKHAYVSGGVLVGAVPSSAIVLSGGVEEIAIKLTAGIFMGTLKPVSGSSTSFGITDGILTGRWALADVFGSLSSFRDGNGKPICTSDFTYQFAKKEVCAAADILADLGSPSTPCDAVSFAISFKADPAEIGDPIPAPVPMMSCAPNADPANDSCF